ncbi:MAG TPA: gamma-glutamyltransferase, partial [Acidobacteria bacterium]|nr:gamma-glutamyltransferase [Acidobacteriota bacterium]
MRTPPRFLPRLLQGLLMITSLLSSFPVGAASTPAPIGTGGAVASGDAAATEAGLAILRAGGNAVDAAV